MQAREIQQTLQYLRRAFLRERLHGDLIESDVVGNRSGRPRISFSSTTLACHASFAAVRCPGVIHGTLARGSFIIHRCAATRLVDTAGA